MPLRVSCHARCAATNVSVVQAALSKTRHGAWVMLPSVPRLLPPLPLLPEELLMLAVLEQTFNEIRYPTKNGGEHVRASAKRWVQSTSTVHPFTFESICHHFELSTQWLRRRLLGGNFAHVKHVHAIPSRRKR